MPVCTIYRTGRVNLVMAGENYVRAVMMQDLWTRERSVRIVCDSL